VAYQGILVFDDLSCESAPPTLRVAGLSLLERGVRTMARAGIRRLLIIVPEGTSLQLSRFAQRLDIHVEFARWGASSPPTFAPSEAFLLLRGDHVHHHSSLTAFVRDGLEGRDCMAQVGPPTAAGRAACWISDLPEAMSFTRLPMPGSRVSAGAFLCASDLFTPGELTAKTGDLWTFLAECLQGRSGACSEVAPEQWQWVSDCHGAREAKEMLFDQVSKSTSGLVARALNVRISVPLSKMLIETGITPNMATVFLVLSTGLFSAYLISQPDTYLRIFLAGVFWQLASVLDGCDGEIARVKLGETKFGAWFDTITDNLSYICAYSGLLIGMHWLQPDNLLPIYAGLSAIASLLLTLGILYAYALKTGTGSLQYYLGDLARKIPDGEKDWSHRLLERFGFVIKRDFLSLFIAVGLIANQFEAVYWSLVFLLHIAALGVLTTQYRLLGERATESRHLVPKLLPAPMLREEEA